MKFSSTFEKITSIVDVLYDLSLMKRLLSIGMIANMGNIVVFNSNKCFVTQNKDPNTVGKRCQGSEKWIVQIGDSFCQVICRNFGSMHNRSRLEDQQFDPMSNHYLAREDGTLPLSSSLQNKCQKYGHRPTKINESKLWSLCGLHG